MVTKVPNQVTTRTPVDTHFLHYNQRVLLLARPRIGHCFHIEIYRYLKKILKYCFGFILILHYLQDIRKFVFGPLFRLHKWRCILTIHTTGQIHTLVDKRRPSKVTLHGILQDILSRYLQVWERCRTGNTDGHYLWCSCGL